METLPKPFTVATQTGEQSFVARRAFNPVGVTISHNLPNKTEGNQVRFNISMAQVAASSLAGTPDLWGRIVDLAILAFKEQHWAERMVSQRVAAATYQDVLEIRADGNAPLFAPEGFRSEFSTSAPDVGRFRYATPGPHRGRHPNTSGGCGITLVQAGSASRSNDA